MNMDLILCIKHVFKDILNFCAVNAIIGKEKHCSNKRKPRPLKGAGTVNVNHHFERAAICDNLLYKRSFD